MTSIGAYLDRVCHRLRANPAAVEDVREELRAHLGELIKEYQRAGVSRPEAIQIALQEFGEAQAIRGWLDQVHQGDPWWVLRLKGLGTGMLLGAMLATVLTLAAPLQPLMGRLWLESGGELGRAQATLNGLLVGGVAGLVCAGGRRFYAAWLLGSLAWLVEYLVYWVQSIAAGMPVPDGGLGMMNAVLLAPVVGGFFALAVGAGTAALLRVLGRLRPEVR